ncbi:MAG: sulfatase [Deltaproteobacteria bacterium]|nr:sulfatase [Deltaproteobacteria bacterium]
MPPEPPNLILVSIDTLRADHVGAYGYPRPTTPHIDSLAGDSVLFEKCVAHAPSTLASHASILTSRLPRHHGASVSRKTRLADGVTTLTEVLREAGYTTASFNGGIQLDRVYGLDRGFDVYVSTQPDTTEVQETLAGDENRLIHGVAQALGWIEKARAPFFLFLHSYEIHHPYTPDEEHLRVFDRGYEGELPDHISVGTLQDINQRRRTIDSADLGHIIDTYDAELRSADEAVGELLAALRAKDLYDGTMIIVTSDHGEEFAERGMVGWHSHTLFDELLLVPCIVKFPRSEHAGRVASFQARGIDLAPTALAGMGLEIPGGFDGVDLGPQVSGDPAPPLPALSMFNRGHDELSWSLRSRGWKLNQWNDDRLYDLRLDPDEKTDVAETKPRRVKQLREHADALLEAREPPADVATRPREETEEQLRALGYIE